MKPRDAHSHGFSRALFSALFSTALADALELGVQELLTFI
jgi:hypothetical protein